MPTVDRLVPNLESDEPYRFAQTGWLRPGASSRCSSRTLLPLVVPAGAPRRHRREQERLLTAGRQLEATNRLQQICGGLLLPRDFTIEADEITPSLKVKRKVIDKKYKDIIDQLYKDDFVDEEREVKRA